MDILAFWKVGLDPVSDPGQPGSIRNCHLTGTFQVFFRIENIVDLFVFGQTIRMDSSPGGIEIRPHKRIIRRNIVLDPVPEKFRHIGDRGGIDAVMDAGDGHPVEHQPLDRGIAGAFTETEERSVDRRAAVKPGGDAVGQDFMKIVVTVPFELFGRGFGIVQDRLNDRRYAAGQRRIRIGHPVAHRIAQPDLDLDPGSFAHFVEFVDHRDHKPENIGAGQVFQMTAWHDTIFQCGSHDLLVAVQCLTPVLFQLQENVVIGAGSQDPGLFQTQRFHQFEIILVRPDPGGHLREIIAQRQTGFHRLAVFLSIQEKFTLADQSADAADPVHELEQLRDLLHGVRRTRLLTVAESRIGDPDLLRTAHRNTLIHKIHCGYPFIGERIPEQIRFQHILQF